MSRREGAEVLRRQRERDEELAVWARLMAEERERPAPPRAGPVTRTREPEYSPPVGPKCPFCGGHPLVDKAAGCFVAHANPPDGREGWERCAGSGLPVDRRLL